MTTLGNCLGFCMELMTSTKANWPPYANMMFMTATSAVEASPGENKCAHFFDSKLVPKCCLSWMERGSRDHAASQMLSSTCFEAGICLKCILLGVESQHEEEVPRSV